MIPRLAAAGTQRHQMTPKSLLLLVFLFFIWHCLASSSSAKQSFFVAWYVVLFTFDTMNEPDTMLPRETLAWY
jgi:hypothetical protein